MSPSTFLVPLLPRWELLSVVHHQGVYLDRYTFPACCLILLFWSSSHKGKCDLTDSAGSGMRVTCARPMTNLTEDGPHNCAREGGVPRLYPLVLCSFPASTSLLGRTG